MKTLSPDELAALVFTVWAIGIPVFLIIYSWQLNCCRQDKIIYAFFWPATAVVFTIRAATIELVAIGESMRENDREQERQIIEAPPEQRKDLREALRMLAKTADTIETHYAEGKSVREDVTGRRPRP